MRGHNRGGGSQGKEEDLIKGFDLNIFVRLFGFLKPYTWVTLLALLALTLATLGDLSVPLLIQKALDGPILNPVGPGSLQDLQNFSLIILAVLMGSMVGSFFQVYLLSWISQMVMKDLRIRLFSHFLSQNAQYHNQNPVGRLVSAVTSDVGSINDFFNTFFTVLLKDLVMMGGVIAALFALNATLAAWTMAIVPFVILLIVLFRKWSREAFRRVRGFTAKLGAFLSEHIMGMGIVQLFGREKASLKAFEEVNQGLLKSNLKEMIVNAVFRPLVDVLSSSTLGILIFFGAGLANEGLITLGILIAFINLVNKFFFPVASIAENFSLLQSAMAGGERVFGFLDEKSVTENSGQADFPTTNQDMSFHKVAFSYNQKESVLKNVSFTVPAGKTVALVGYTGAGKTTITSLLTRMWDVNDGEILYGDVNIKNFELNQLRKGIQSVLQDVFLFSGTVRSNILLGKDWSQDQLETICKAVRAHDFIQALPQGYDTVLNEGSTNISAGQRQLISFARVLVQDPSVLILDEATANIDTETERLIQEALAVLLEGRTSLIIAHRLSTIRHAHKILVLDRGEVVEEGTHEDLIGQGGFYYNLYKLQYEKQKMTS